MVSWQVNLNMDVRPLCTDWILRELVSFTAMCSCFKSMSLPAELASCE